MNKIFDIQGYNWLKLFIKTKSKKIITTSKCLSWNISVEICTLWENELARIHFVSLKECEKNWKISWLNFFLNLKKDEK